MQIKCGNCGRNILVPDDLAAGQHVRCPYCNEKSAFDRPSRIELPTAVRPILERPSLERPPEIKPKLGIRRTAQTPTHDREHMNAAAAAVDARVRQAERRRRMLAIKKALGNWISILFLLAILWIGYVVWQSVRKREMPTMPARVTQFLSNAIEKVKVEGLGQQRNDKSSSNNPEKVNAEIAK